MKWSRVGTAALSSLWALLQMLKGNVLFGKQIFLNLYLIQTRIFIPQTYQAISPVDCSGSNTIGNILFLVRWLTVTKYQTHHWITWRPSKMFRDTNVSPTITFGFLHLSLYGQAYFSTQKWIMNGIHTLGLNSVTCSSSTTRCRSAGGRRERRNLGGGVNLVLHICLYRSAHKDFQSIIQFVLR